MNNVEAHATPCRMARIIIIIDGRNSINNCSMTGDKWSTHIVLILRIYISMHTCTAYVSTDCKVRTHQVYARKKLVSFFFFLLNFVRPDHCTPYRRGARGVSNSNLLGKDPGSARRSKKTTRVPLLFLNEQNVSPFRRDKGELLCNKTVSVNFQEISQALATRQSFYVLSDFPRMHLHLAPMHPLADIMDWRLASFSRRDEYIRFG